MRLLPLRGSRGSFLYAPLLSLSSALDCTFPLRSRANLGAYLGARPSTCSPRVLARELHLDFFVSRFALLTRVSTLGSRAAFQCIFPRLPSCIFPGFPGRCFQQNAIVMMMGAERGKKTPKKGPVTRDGIYERPLTGGAQNTQCITRGCGLVGGGLNLARELILQVFVVLSLARELVWACLPCSPLARKLVLQVFVVVLWLASPFF